MTDSLTLDEFEAQAGHPPKDVAALLMQLPVLAAGEKNPQGLIVCAGEASADLKHKWRARLNYFCNKHNREYRIRYFESKGVTALVCTHPDRREKHAQGSVSGVQVAAL